MYFVSEFTHLSSNRYIITRTLSRILFTIPVKLFLRYRRVVYGRGLGLLGGRWLSDLRLERPRHPAFRVIGRAKIDLSRQPIVCCSAKLDSQRIPFPHLPL